MEHLRRILNQILLKNEFERCLNKLLDKNKSTIPTENQYIGNWIYLNN